nr:hypothetical protein [Tanacetum cinerariifolium]
MSQVGLFLHMPVFSRNKLYVVVSKVKSIKGLKIISCNKDDVDMHSESQDGKLKQLKLDKKGIMQYVMQIHATMLNDAIKEIDDYKEYMIKGKRVVVLMVQPKLVILHKEYIRNLKPWGSGKLGEKFDDEE